MGRYRRNRYGGRNRTGRRVLPLLFCLMIGAACFLILGKTMPEWYRDILVIRDTGLAGSHIPSETDDRAQETDVPPDRVITGSYADRTSRRTSAALDAETGNDPVETLASLKSETAAPEAAAPPEIGLRDRIPPEYDYAFPVPEGEPMTRDYFHDAVLVGDSRMQGLILYCGLSKVTSYTYKGLTVDSVFSRPIIEWEEDENLPAAERIPEELWDDGKVPVMEALRQTEYSKVYIMLGINETGWPDPAYFPMAYAEVIDAIREDNPQCLIYMLSVFPVTQAVSEYHDYVTNEKIALYNQYLQQLAYEKEVFLIDLAPAVVNEDGVLPADSGVDGIHLNKTYCTKVLDHILSHTVPLIPEEEIRAAETETDETA